MTLPIVRVESKWNSVTTRKYMQPGEIEILLTLIDSVAPKSMIEFGVNEGITALAVLTNFPNIERYVGVDVQFDHQLSIPAQQVEVPVDPGILVLGDSRFELILRPSYRYLSFNYDVAFIDGDHGRAAVELDYDYAKQIVNDGGIIIFHDYANPTVQVTEALDHLHTRGANIKSVEGTWLAFENVHK